MTRTAWMMIDRNTGNSYFVSKDETKVRAKCEMANIKAGRERYYVRPFDI